MRRVLGAALGAILGLAFSTSGLVDLSEGFTITTLGGNDATPTVTAVGTAIGALVGATMLWRYPLAIVGAIVGLAAGMWLRDNLISGSQAPRVFLLIFGLPLLGAAGGYLLPPSEDDVGAPHGRRRCARGSCSCNRELHRGRDDLGIGDPRPPLRSDTAVRRERLRSALSRRRYATMDQSWGRNLGSSSRHAHPCKAHPTRCFRL